MVGVAQKTGEVALRKESVDRNMTWGAKKYATTYVALRKESVDRNDKWEAAYTATDTVALRKESVDRNSFTVSTYKLKIRCRSPQGERG